jgi:hypothetical protein
MILSKFAKLLLLWSTVSVGIGVAWLSWLKVSAIGTLLFMNHTVPHNTVGMVEQVLAFLLLTAVVTLFFEKTRIYGAGFIFLYLGMLIYATIDQGGHPFSDYTFAAYAMRFATPLAFVLVFSLYLQSGYKEFTINLAVWVIIMATFTTFFMHGLEAIWAHPWFVDMTIGMASNLIGWRMSQSVAEQMLIAVGILDIISAIALVVFKSKIAALWMCFWGFFTCFLRLVNFGAGAIPDAIVRIPHGLLPLMLFNSFKSDSVKSFTSLLNFSRLNHRNASSSKPAEL